MKFQCPIAETSTKYPDTIAFVSDRENYTYKQLDDLVSKTVDQLVKTDGAVIMDANKNLQTICQIFACIRLKKTIFLLFEKLPNKVKLSLSKKVSSFQKSNPEHFGIIIATSGSESLPKLASLSFDNVTINAIGTLENCPLEPGDTYLLNLPLFHVSGLGIIFRTFLSGATLELRTDKLTNITHLSLVSSQLQQLLDNPPPLKRLKMMLLGGSPFPESMIQKAISQGWPVYNTYGCTEMGSQITTSPSAITSSQQGSGFCLKNREIKIKNQNEIWVKGPCLFQGYIVDDQLNLDKDENGWFFTGDLGKMDEKNGLFVLGRKDNQFVSGGENMSSEEIELALMKIEGIKDAVVVPVPDQLYGERPVAFIEKGDGISVDWVRDKLLEHLPEFKIPDHFFVFPKKTGFKRMRSQLKKQAVVLLETVLVEYS